MKTVGTTSVPVNTEAILSNARLESGDVDAPMATAVESQNPDSYEASVASSDKPSNSELDEARNEANPFDGLEQGQAEDVRLSEQPHGLERPIDPNAAQLARLNAAMLAMLRAGKEVPAHLLEGYLMTGHDAQAAEKPLGQLKEAFAAYTTKLAANEATEADHKVFWAQVSVGEQDVMSFVQRVLREAYMIQNGTMYDMANQLKQTNDLRKKIRDELSRARATSASWATQSKGVDTWASPTPYLALRVNHDAYALEPDTMDPDELAQHEADIQTESDENVGGTPYDAVAALYATDSKLTPTQLMDLGGIDLISDDSIKDNLDTLKAAIPSMNGNELRMYVETALDALNDGNTDEGAIKEIFETLSPEQILFVVADGYNCKKFDFGNSDANAFRKLTVERLITSFGSAISPTDVAATSDTSHQRTINQLSPQQAQALLAKYDQAPPAVAPKSDGAKVGDQKTISTNKGMDAYIQGLEDTVNSLGDDAQMQQIDLQDALQKNQQTLQMMSNLLKVVHDTAMAVIRNDNS